MMTRNKKKAGRGLTRDSWVEYDNRIVRRFEVPTIQEWEARNGKKTNPTDKTSNKSDHALPSRACNTPEESKDPMELEEVLDENEGALSQKDCVQKNNEYDENKNKQKLTDNLEPSRVRKVFHGTNHNDSNEQALSTDAENLRKKLGSIVQQTETTKQEKQTDIDHETTNTDRELHEVALNQAHFRETIHSVKIKKEKTDKAGTALTTFEWASNSDDDFTNQSIDDYTEHSDTNKPFEFDYNTQQTTHSLKGVSSKRKLTQLNVEKLTKKQFGTTEENGSLESIEEPQHPAVGNHAAADSSDMEYESSENSNSQEEESLDESNEYMNTSQNSSSFITLERSPKSPGASNKKESIKRYPLKSAELPPSKTQQGTVRYEEKSNLMMDAEAEDAMNMGFETSAFPPQSNEDESLDVMEECTNEVPQSKEKESTFSDEHVKNSKTSPNNGDNPLPDCAQKTKTTVNSNKLTENTSEKSSAKLSPPELGGILTRPGTRHFKTSFTLTSKQSKNTSGTAYGGSTRFSGHSVRFSDPYSMPKPDSHETADERMKMRGINMTNIQKKISTPVKVEFNSTPENTEFSVIEQAQILLDLLNASDPYL